MAPFNSPCWDDSNGDMSYHNYYLVKFGSLLLTEMSGKFDRFWRIDDSINGRPIGIIICLIDRDDQGLSIGGVFVFIGRLGGKILADLLSWWNCELYRMMMGLKSEKPAIVRERSGSLSHLSFILSESMWQRCLEMNWIFRYVICYLSLTTNLILAENSAADRQISFFFHSNLTSDPIIEQ